MKGVGGVGGAGGAAQHIHLALGHLRQKGKSILLQRQNSSVGKEKDGRTVEGREEKKKYGCVCVAPEWTDGGQSRR